MSTLNLPTDPYPSLPIPSGRLQREALILANHGPLGMVRGLKAQAKALVKRGYLFEDLSPTEDGKAAYAEMGRARSWAEACRLLPSWVLSGGSSRWGGNPLYATPSVDGSTVYLSAKGFEPVAVEAATIPTDTAKRLGLTEVAA